MQTILVSGGAGYIGSHTCLRLSEAGFRPVVSANLSNGHAAFAQWGPDCLTRFRGMWGIVVVDLVTGAAYASRDRLGIKPLYFARHDGVLAFVSEIKQLQALPNFRFRAETAALL